MITHGKQFLGITTLGEKGQVVIPAEARLRMKLKTGEKLMVMTPHGGAIVLMKTAQFEAFA
jgi:AbrB family looped-hinge helix DNA binding protein